MWQKSLCSGEIIRVHVYGRGRIAVVPALQFELSYFVVQNSHTVGGEMEGSQLSVHSA